MTDQINLRKGIGLKTYSQVLNFSFTNFKVNKFNRFWQKCNVHSLIFFLSKRSWIQFTISLFKIIKYSIFEFHVLPKPLLFKFKINLKCIYVKCLWECEWNYLLGRNRFENPKCQFVWKITNIWNLDQIKWCINKSVHLWNTKLFGYVLP